MKSSTESRIMLALEALRQNPRMTLRSAARIYGVDKSTLCQRRRGRQPRCETRPNSRKLTDLEETTLSEYILELDSKGFPPRVSMVGDMANRLLNDRNGGRVGINWPSTFIKRHPKLKTQFNRPYDYQRAKCEDPKIIKAWFELVQNTIAKYRVQEEDIYNFDKTEFLIGMISNCMVVTAAEKKAKAKSIQPGNKEWTTVIQGVNSQGLSILSFMIVTGETHLQSWYTNSGFPCNWVIFVTKKGWATNKQGLE